MSGTGEAGTRQCGRGPRCWTERRSRASAERGSSHLGRGSSDSQESILRSNEPLEAVPQSPVRSLTVRHIPESGS